MNLTSFSDLPRQNERRRTPALMGESVGKVMRRWLQIGVLGAVAALGVVQRSDAQPPASNFLDEAAAARFAHLALSCLHKEYPGKVSYVMLGDADALPPRRLTPAFYGCYDWHSAVHGHWLLVRLLHLFPSAPFA